MNNKTAIAIYCDTIAKLPQDFIEKNANKVFGVLSFVVALPFITDVAHVIGDNFRYWVDAKYGVTVNTIVEPAEATVYSEPTAA